MKLTWLFFVGLIVFALTRSFVYADGGDESLIHACLNQVGNTRIVGASETCRPRETSIHWGITGPQGPKGDKGDKGDTGDTGAIDLSKIFLRTCTDVFTCFCLENERVLGGGAECELPFLGIHLRNSSPIVESYDDGTPHEGWFAECSTSTDDIFEPSTIGLCV